MNTTTATTSASEAAATPTTTATPTVGMWDQGIFLISTMVKRTFQHMVGSPSPADG